jgi:hypothetical protein
MRSAWLKSKHDEEKLVQIFFPENLKKEISGEILIEFTLKK